MKRFCIPGLTGFRALAAALGLAAAAPALAQQPASPPPTPLAGETTPPAPPLPGAGAVDRLTSTTSVCPCPAPEEQKPETPPNPYTGSLFERAKLTGNWCGARSALVEHGITWDISSTNFYQGVTTGGVNQTFDFGGHSDILLNVNGEKAGLWKGFFIDLHAETLYGTSANNATGAISPISTAQILPTTNPPVMALTGVKFTQALSENFVLFAGKINTVDGFNQPFTGGAPRNGRVHERRVAGPTRRSSDDALLELRWRLRGAQGPAASLHRDGSRPEQYPDGQWI